MSDEHWKGLGKLIEECGEVLQLAGKAVPFPIGDHPDGKGPIKARMELELADLLASISYVIEANELDTKIIEDRSYVKLELFYMWNLTGLRKPG